MMKKQILPALLVALLVALLAAALLSGCGSSSSGDSHNYGASPTAPAEISGNGATYESGDSAAAAGTEAAEAGVDDAGAEGPTLTQPQDGRRVILNANLTIEALDFTATCQAIETAAQESGGYISNTQINSQDSYYDERNANFTVRVPAENYGDFLTKMGDAGNLVSRSENSEDVTSAYVDIEARLTSLRAQEQRLMELMEEAGDLADLITIQDQLADVQYEIENYTAQRNTYDELIAYSTVTVYVYEVVELTEPIPETYGARVARAFVESWRMFVDFWREFSIILVYALPALVVIAVIAAIVLFFAIRSHRKRKKNPPPARPPRPAYAAQGAHPGWDAYTAYYGNTAWQPANAEPSSAQAAGQQPPTGQAEATTPPTDGESPLPAETAASEAPPASNTETAPDATEENDPGQK